MFKALIAAAALSVATALPSFAAPSTCWLSNNTANGEIPAQSCDVHVRNNANGHTVIDVMTPVDNGQVSIVLWADSNNNPSYAEVFFRNQGRITMKFRWDNAGDLHLYNNDIEFYVSVPN